MIERLHISRVSRYWFALFEVGQFQRPIALLTPEQVKQLQRDITEALKPGAEARYARDPEV